MIRTVAVIGALGLALAACGGGGGGGAAPGSGGQGAPPGGTPYAGPVGQGEGKLSVLAWPGYPYIVFADTATPSVYLAWQKGIAWMPIIIGILVVTLLPPLLGTFIWLILPEEVKQLINALIGMGMMLLVMWLMMSLIKPLTAAERPKELREASA